MALLADRASRLSDWLTAHGCTHVAMESTGEYWKPVWHVLEASVELVLANTMHVRNIPGRKSDVNDATWLADLLAHGLIWEGARADDSPVGAAARGPDHRVARARPTRPTPACTLPIVQFC